MKKLLLTLLAPSLFTFTLSAQNLVYSNIPNPAPIHVPSEGPEAYYFAELGGGVEIPTPAIGATMHKVSVVMDSWACQQGRWYLGTCVSKKNASFDQPITLNIYSAIGENPVALLGTMTDNFKMPYRPSSDPINCPATPTKWYSSVDNKCYNGIASVITFNVTPLGIALPAKVILTVGYNTTTNGPHPLGAQPCSSASAGCPYDALNIGLGATFGDLFINKQVGSPTIAGLVNVPPADAEGYPQFEILGLPNSKK
jgi:hypothetical protein